MFLLAPPRTSWYALTTAARPEFVGHVVGHGEQRLGHLVAALGQVVAEVGTTRRLEVSPVRLKLVDDARQAWR